MGRRLHREQQLRRSIDQVATVPVCPPSSVSFLLLNFLIHNSAFPRRPPPPLLAFTANFGPGFDWFAGCCIFSLAAQQMTAGWFTRPRPEEA